MNILKNSWNMVIWVNSFGWLHENQISSLSMYNLIIPCNLSHNLVPKYCNVGAGLALMVMKQ